MIERADHAGDPQPQLPTRLQLDRERRAGRQPQRLRQPEADLRLAVAAQPRPRLERRCLEQRVVAGIGDHVDRLAERVRVDGLLLVARGDGLHAADPAHARDRGGGQIRGQLVALAERLRVGLERAERGREREHQQHERGRETERGDGGDQARTAGADEPRAEHGQPGASARRPGRPPGTVAPPPAPELGAARAAPPATVPPRATPATPPRAPGSRSRPAHASRERGQQRRPRRGLVEQHEQPVGRAVRGERAPDRADRRRRRRDEQRLERLRARQVRARGPDRAAYADRAEPALDLGARGRGQHHARGGERDQRQRHEQVDHDPRRLVEQHVDARARDEPQPLEAVAGRARLDEHLAQVARIAQPDVGEVDVGPAASRIADGPRCEMYTRGVASG